MPCFFMQRYFCLFLIIVVYLIIYSLWQGKEAVNLRARHWGQVCFSAGHKRMKMTNLKCYSKAKMAGGCYSALDKGLMGEVMCHNWVQRSALLLTALRLGTTW